MSITSKAALKKREFKVMPENSGYYPEEAIPTYMKKIAKRNEKKIRERRSDLVVGNIVVVLEGDFISKRVVFLKQVEENKALCCGPASINGVPFFTIDEKFLLKTSTVLDVKLTGSELFENVFESSSTKSLEAETIIKSLTRNATEEKIDSDISKKVKDIKFMRKYMETDFVLPTFTGISSLKF